MHLPVGLGNTLELILLLDGVGVGGSLGGVDKLVSEALSNGLDVAEGSFTSTSGEEVDGLVDTTKGRDIDGLTTDSSLSSDTSGIFAGAGVDDGIDGNLDGVLVSEQVDDLKGMLDNADSHKLLSVVAAVHHEGVGHTLNDGALGLTETLGSVTSSRVGKELGVSLLDGNVVNKGDVGTADIIEGPAVEELHLSSGSDVSHYCSSNGARGIGNTTRQFIKWEGEKGEKTVLSWQETVVIGGKVAEKTSFHAACRNAGRPRTRIPFTSSGHVSCLRDLHRSIRPPNAPFRSHRFNLGRGMLDADLTGTAGLLQSVPSRGLQVQSRGAARASLELHF